MKILLIDDDTDLLEMTARRLTKRGAVAICAVNLQEATAKMEENLDLNAIICDLFLKDGENGLSFYESQVQKKFKGKFLLATGDESADVRIEKYKQEDPLFFCLEKPYSIEKAFEILS